MNDDDDDPTKSIAYINAMNIDQAFDSQFIVVVKFYAPILAHIPPICLHRPVWHVWRDA